MKNDAWKPLFHELWGNYKDGVPYDQEVKAKWGELLSILERITKGLDGKSAR